MSVTPFDFDEYEGMVWDEKTIYLVIEALFTAHEDKPKLMMHNGRLHLLSPTDNSTVFTITVRKEN